MRKTFFSLLYIILLLAYVPALHAQGRVECASTKSAVLNRSVRYCALLPAGYDENQAAKYPVLYFLHGLGDNERTLINSGAWGLIEELQQAGRIGNFIVVTPEGGRTFYVNSKDGKLRYEDFFIREFLPAIEKRYRIHAMRARRAIGGVSMGGYGALRFALKYPQLFTSVAVHMPALAEKIPQALANVGGSRGGLLGSAFGTPLDVRYWEANSPFALARTARNLHGLKIYFDVGRSDEFGFDTGAEQFDKLLDRLKIKHKYHLREGHHDARFVLENFDDSLAFQSKALGLIK